MNEIDIVLNCEKPSEFVKLAEKKVQEWNPEYVRRGETKRYKNISNSQLRNVFDYVLKIKNVKDQSLYMLKPKLAYIKGRNEKIPDDFVVFLNKLIDGINEDDNKLNNFKKFFEAIIAYNKQYGGD